MKSQMRYNSPWIIGIQGAIMAIFGIAAIVNPEITLKTITRFFGILLLLSGVFLLILTKTKSSDLPVFWFYEGIVNVTIGLLFVLFPAFVTNIFIIIIGLFALVIGIKNIWILLNNKQELIKLSVIRNVILVGFGLLFLFVPFKGAQVIINIIGIFALLYGVITLYAAYKLFQSNAED